MRGELKQSNKAKRQRKNRTQAGGPPPAARVDETATCDPLAQLFFHQLRTRSAVDVVRVYAELQHRFPLESDDDHSQWCVDALRACVSAKGRASLPCYQEFWSALPDRSAWPSHNVIRRTFGDWTAARARVEAVPRTLGRAQRLRTQPTFSTAGIKETLEVWLDELGDDGLAQRLRCEAFIEWCRSRIGDPAYAGLDLPVDPKTIRKYFGGWQNALEEVGAYHRAAHLRTTRTRPYDAVSDDDLRDVLIEAIALWAEVPSYDEYCQAQRSGSKALPDRPIPPGPIIVSRFGGWNAALIHGGLLSPEAAAQRTCSRRERITTEFALGELRRAIQDLGPEVGRGAYRGWRARHIERHGKGAATPPSDTWLCSQFDSWDRAKELAMGSWAPHAQEVAA